MVKTIASKASIVRPRRSAPAASVLAGLAAVLAAGPAGAEDAVVVPAGPATASEAAVVPAAGVAHDAPAPFRPFAESPIPSQGEAARIPAAPGGLPIDFSGYFWVDSGVMDSKTTQPGKYDQLANYMQGRMVLAATYQRPFGDYFGRARVEFLGLVNEFSKSQYEAHTLDAYAMFGGKKWDVQIGRFLPWEVYHRGQGIELFTAEERGAGGPGLAWLDTTRRYFDEAGQAAIHYYPFQWLGFELSSVYGQQTGQNWLGVRPAAALQLGGFQALAGWEVLQQSPQNEADKVEATTTGWAGRLQYDFPWLTLGVNYGASEADVTNIKGENNPEASLEKWSAGAFADVNFHRNHSVGLGYHHTEQLNRQNETSTHDQTFVSYLFRLPFEGASVKAVYGFARATDEDVDVRSKWSNDMHSFRIRLAYELK